ncbi:MAG: archaeal proteasome endopeptidase complex subunit beta [Candidatus Jordarchaeales archaeon]
MAGYPDSATSVGITCSDGVVLASEKRITWGDIVLSRKGRKVFKITDRIGVACAGLVSDMQVLARRLEAISNIYFMEEKKPIPVRTAAKILANILFDARLYPLLTQIIIGGIDKEGPVIYVLDPLGSILKEKYAAVGSGSYIAFGTLERFYRDGLSVNEGREIAIRSIRAAARRDVGSGEGIDIIIITNDGAKIESIEKL